MSVTSESSAPASPTFTANSAATPDSPMSPVVSNDLKNNNSLLIPESPSSESERSGTPSSTVSTAATSIADGSDLASKQNSVSSTTSTSKDNNNNNNKDGLTKEAKKELKEKKKANKIANRVSTAASGISTTVPVSGERPKPTPHPTLDDDVLFAIFGILYEYDPKAEGMTVKQICDILTEKHPDMANLSSKTSNLVSAKLNAYVKRVEKGEKSIIYALSRDWADASPKRMVYVYRGLLTKDYFVYVQKVLESQKASAAANPTGELNSNFMGSDKSSNMNQNMNFANGISPAGLELNSKSAFLDAAMDLRAPQLSIPYSSAPVTAALNFGPLKTENENEDEPNQSKSSKLPSGNNNFKKSIMRQNGVKNGNGWLSALHDSDSDSEGEDEYSALESEYDEEDADVSTNMIPTFSHSSYRRGSLLVKEKVPSSISKRSKSMSYLSSKRPKHVTAAAAAPRLSKTPVANSPSAAAAVAALRAAALSSFAPGESVSSITSSIMSDTSVEPSISMKWLETVRSGFLNQEIGTPEDISLAELDTLFT